MNILTLAIIFIVGFVVMAPVGPVSTICIRRSLLFGWLAGLTCGAGDAIAVALYATIGITGSTLMINVLKPFTTISHILIAIVLLIVALVIWKAKPQLPETAVPTTTNLAVGFVLTLGITLMNPGDIVLFAAIFAGIGITVHSVLEYVLFYSAMFLGGITYWVVLVLFLNKWRLSMTTRHIMILNRVCAGLMTAVAAASLFSIDKQESSASSINAIKTIVSK